MSRWVPALVLAGAVLLCAQDPKPQPPEPSNKELKRRGQPSNQPPTKDMAPPEEDTSLSTNKEYSFNPLQAKKDITTGNYYFKKGSYRAAAGRFEDATKWNDGDTEAWLRLGETKEKLKDHKAAREAYAKYLELAPDAKNAADIRKKLEKLNLAKD